MGQVHLAHAPGTELLADFVVRECLADHAGPPAALFNESRKCNKLNLVRGRLCFRGADLEDGAGLQRL